MEQHAGQAAEPLVGEFQERVAGVVVALPQALDQVLQPVLARFGHDFIPAAAAPMDLGRRTWRGVRGWLRSRGAAGIPCSPDPGPWESRKSLIRSRDSPSCTWREGSIALMRSAWNHVKR